MGRKNNKPKNQNKMASKQQAKRHFRRKFSMKPTINQNRILQSPLKINVYIDAANLDKGIKGLKWKLDYQRFYKWLKDKYRINKAYIFIGLVPKFKDIYIKLQEIGFVLVFKETVADDKGKIKVNCDADLVLHMIKDFYEKKFDRSISYQAMGIMRRW